MAMSRTAIDLYNLKIPVAQLRNAIAGGAIATKPQIAALTPNATANGSDAATTQALANSLKTTVNAIIAALKA